MKYFSPTIADLIERSGKSQRELARTAGITEGRLSNWKAGRDDLNGDVLLKLSKSLNVSLRDLAQARKRTLAAEESQAMVLREGPDDTSWLLSGQTVEQLLDGLKRALDDSSVSLAERCRRAQILFDEIQRRASQPVSSEPDAAAIVLLRKAGAEAPRETPAPEPTPGVDAPSAPASGRSPGVSPETTTRPRPPVPAPGKPGADD